MGMRREMEIGKGMRIEKRLGKGIGAGNVKKRGRVKGEEEAKGTGKAENKKGKIALHSVVVEGDHGRMNYKDTKPYMSAFLKIDLSTDFEALCLTDLMDWRYIHSVVCIFNPASL
jgi:hypothetical protein